MSGWAKRRVLNVRLLIRVGVGQARDDLPAGRLLGAHVVPPELLARHPWLYRTCFLEESREPEPARVVCAEDKPAFSLWIGD
jgi:hypothetical protein